MVILFSKYAIFKEILNFKIVMINKVTIWIFSLSCDQNIALKTWNTKTKQINALYLVTLIALQSKNITGK